MEWFYAKDGERLGPFSESTLEQRLASGEITEDTLVWRRGMEDWTELRTVRSESPAGKPVFNAPAADPGGVCLECERRFPETELVRVGGRATCADCKPTVLQKLQEGLLVSGDGQAWRSGKRVVVTLKGKLPNRCVVCNQPAEGEPARLKVSWAPSFGAFFMIAMLVLVGLSHLFWTNMPIGLPLGAILGGGVVVVVVSILFGRRVEVTYGYCQAHRRRVALGAMLITSSKVIPLVLFLVWRNFTWIWPVVGMFILVHLVVALVGDGFLSVAKATSRLVWLKGARRPFLDSLPEWKEP